MKKTACIIGSLILAGCASAGRIGDLPKIADGVASSTLVVVRPTNVIGMANSDYVAFDGKDVFSIRSGENTRFSIPAGQHTITVKCFGGWSPTWKEDTKSLFAEKGETDYFSISPSLTCSKIEKVSEAEGQSLLERTTFIDPAISSNRDIQSSQSTRPNRGVRSSEPTSPNEAVRSSESTSSVESVQPNPVGSSQCPIELRHGVREAVCASLAMSAPMAPSYAQAAPAAVVQTSPSLAAPATPAAPAASTATQPHTRVVTKTVGGQQITCDIPLPKYPSEARKLHQTGTAIVRITIWPPNIVKQLTVTESSGNTTLDAAAMRAAEGTVCTSAERRFQLFQSFQFDLRNGSDAQRDENAEAFAQ